MKIRTTHRVIIGAAWLGCLAGWSGPLAAQGAAPPTPSPNWLAFANGALPLRVQADTAARVGVAQAMAAIDGNDKVYSLTGPVPADARVVLLVQLAAPTVFERLAVPNVLETPSPAQSFVRELKVFGSARSPDEGFVPLGAATLSPHRQRGQTSELAMQPHEPVRWVRVELMGALDPAQRAGTLEFSELIGQGRQSAAAHTADVSGLWRGRGLVLGLRQTGSLVEGCYDRRSRLEGSVQGSVLRASGTAPDSGVPSAFLAGFVGEGQQRQLVVLRSTHRAPFHLTVAEAAAPGTLPACDLPAPVAPGCGSVLHGLQFDFDTATLRADAQPVLDALQKGLAAATASRIRIEGHTSSEGDAAYNLRLSERRAAAVVEALAQRGIQRQRLAAAGLGETRPLAPNDDETGRVLNRRVEVHCTP